jgi:hypothetical protein
LSALFFYVHGHLLTRAVAFLHALSLINVRCRLLTCAVVYYVRIYVRGRLLTCAVVYCVHGRLKTSGPEKERLFSGFPRRLFCGIMALCRRFMTEILDIRERIHL